MWWVTYGSCFVKLLNQGLVIVKDTCEATITKKLAWLVEPLVVRSHEFSFFIYFILEIYQKSKIHSFLCFLLLCFHCILHFSFFIFFSFHSLEHWRTFNIHVNIPCKLLSPSVHVNSTRFSLYAITKVSRKPKHTLLTRDFKTYTFHARFSPDHTLLDLFGERRVVRQVDEIRFWG